MASASPEWLVKELSSIDAQCQGRLEEFMFLVAQDLVWADGYTISVPCGFEVEDESSPRSTNTIARTDQGALRPMSINESGSAIPVALAKTSADQLLLGPPICTDVPQGPHTGLAQTTENTPDNLETMKNKTEESQVASLDDSALCDEQLIPEKIAAASDARLLEPSSETPQSLRKIMLSRNASEDRSLDLVSIGRTSEASRHLSNFEGEETALESPNVACKQPSNASDNEANSKRDPISQPADQDYMEPINLASPQKKDHLRADSAYFSAAESPDFGSKSTSSPRHSIAFASLPPRQPFSKKSMGPRSSHSRTSVVDPPKISTNNSLSQRLEGTSIKLESVATPIITSRKELAMIKTDNEHEIRSGQLLQTHTIKSEHEAHPILANTNEPDEGPKANRVPEGSVIRSLFRPVTVENPFEVRVDGYQENEFEDTVQNDHQPAPEPLPSEEDNWLPKFDMPLASPRRHGLEEVNNKSKVSDKADKIPRLIPLGNKSVEAQVAPPTDVQQDDKMTPGPIRAAMQAASAKATSYLRQARTAFGSPSINHARVFPTTTPIPSPPRRTIKPEPETPKLYPELPVAVLSQKPTMIPSKTPSKTPLSRIVTCDSQPRRSPRRSPKKGSQASQGMAIMAARSATATAQKDRANKDGDEWMIIDVDTSSSPKKASKIQQKFVPQPKAKPLSIRVATASQREFESTKDRKLQPSTAASQPISGMSGPSRITSDAAVQLDYLTQPPTGTAKRVAPSRQIKALAAANQAKEKAEKEQERRELQRKEMERKRQENAKRAADEEERRKLELSEEANRKRKLPSDAKTVSAKKQVKQISSKNQLRDPPTMERVTEIPSTKLALQSLKRSHVENEDIILVKGALTQDPKRRCTEEAYERSSITPHLSQSIAPLASKPVRVSLQKKSLFGNPGEPGYKKPGTNTLKSVATLEMAKHPHDSNRSTNGHALGAGDASKPVNLPPSELIELPEINSDYSDSDDDEPVQKDGFERPAWANTPELRKLLRRQQRIDPDDVFGPIQPLQMEEIFKGKERALARFRPRSSSANWGGNDRLTAEEVTEYAKVMGFKN